jgi:uncharacterized membrane protein YphA (DoxX/SURF4 family)
MPEETLTTAPPVLPYASADAQPGTSRLVFAWLGRILVGGLFIGAALGKLSDLPKFAKEIRAYEMAPIEVTNAMAIVIPWLELVVAAALLTGLWRNEGRVLLILMLAAFTAAKITAEIRGLELACGCFGGFLAALEKSLSGVNGIILNLVLLGLLGMEFACSRRRSLVAHPLREAPPPDSAEAGAVHAPR